QADEADHRADETPRVEEVERQNFRGERRQHVEAAAVHVQIDEGECAQILEALPVERHQQVAVLRMGVIVPAQSIITERQGGDDRQRTEHCDRGAVEHAGERALVCEGRGHGWCGSRCADAESSESPWAFIAYYAA